MRRTPKADPPSREDLAAALGALGAESLREVVQELLLELDARAYGRMVGSILRRATGAGSGWAPKALGEADLAEVTAFAEAAMRVGRADPRQVDERLLRGLAAFLRKDYGTARRIFEVLLIPIGEAEIDLGQHETVDEVLGVDVNECAASYVVSVYMTSDPALQAEAVRAAMREVEAAAYIFEPIREMERVAVEPLPGLEAFLPRWRDLVAEEAAGERQSEWETEADRWLQAVTERLEGAAGLAKIARSTRAAGDLHAWCQCLVRSGDWKAALAGCEEAAGLVSDRVYARGAFLDGAALAAQELGRKDLSPWLARAWRGVPSLPRLRRWLGAASSRQALRKRASEALEASPKLARRQRALLHVLLGDFEAAAELLAAAPGLGWSDGEHPGHLLFPLFCALLKKGGALQEISFSARGMDCDGFDDSHLDPERPRLAMPELASLLRRAGMEGIPQAGARAVALSALRQAARKRVAGVTENQRRNHYGHAASLVADAVACDPSFESDRWAAGLREEFRRFPALKAELDRRLGVS